MKWNGKTNRIYLLPTCIFIIVVLCSHFIHTENRTDHAVDSWYMLHLERLKHAVSSIQQNCEQQNAGVLKSSFLTARIAYKKLSPITDYFNTYATKQLNGPVLSTTEEDNPHEIIDPHGFQVIEELLFSKGGKIQFKKVQEETGFILEIINELEQEPDRTYKFKDALVWDALRSAVLRVSTLGIAGFDSPVAKRSMEESAAVLEGIGELISLFPTSGNASCQKALLLLTGAKNYLLANRNFDAFDHLNFITKYMNPLYGQIVSARLELKYFMPEERRPLNVDSTSFLDHSSFNLNYFSPNSRYLMTKERITLGERLFNDPVLSANNKRSCASCHIPQKAFADGLKAPMDISGHVSLTRNTPTLWNSVFQTKFFYDSRETTLENQLNAVVHSESEMQGSLQELEVELRQDKAYAPLFRDAYPNEQEPISQYSIANAISSYVRSLVALDSKFDQYVRGDADQLTADEKAGFNLFMGKGKCGTCHFMPLFNGLVPPDFSDTESEVLGVPKTKDKKRLVLDEDIGKYGFTRSVVQKFSFKTPTLRNVALTAPYMHNGVFTTLEEVMDFYNKGGGSGLGIAPETQTLPAEPLGLSKKEIKQIILFLHSLTDTSGQTAKRLF